MGIVGLLALITAIALWFWHKRQNNKKSVWNTQDIMVSAWDPSPSPSESHAMYETSSMPSSLPLLGSPNYPGTSSDILSPTPFLSSPNDSASSSHANLPTIVTPSDSVPRNSKAAEIRRREDMIMSRHASTTSSSPLASPTSQYQTGASSSDGDGMYHQTLEARPSVIIQHLDGGSGGVQELPPPYMARSVASTSAAEPEVQEESPPEKRRRRPRA